MQVDYGELNRRFTQHGADADAVERMDAVRSAARTLAAEVLQAVPEGSERALALTKIEEAMFWSNAAIAREGR